MKLDVTVIRKALAHIHTIKQSNEGVWVGTSCVLPHGEAISVLISQGKNGYLVSDYSYTFSSIVTLGYEIQPSHYRRAKNLAKDFYINFDNGAFFIDSISEEQLASAILWIANTSQLWANEILSAEIKRQEKHIKQRILQIARSIVPEKRIISSYEVHGESNKSHTIDYAIETANENYLLLQSVTSNANSISSNFVKFHDIKRNHPKYICEYITEGLWKAEDLNLISDVGDGIIFLDKDENALAQKIKKVSGA